MTTTPEEAQEAWRKRIARVAFKHSYLSREKDIIFTDAAEYLLDDFKSSLHKSIEERIKSLKSKKYTHRNMSAYDFYAADELEKVLELLDTCTP